MGLHRDLTYTQITSNLFVRQTGNNERQHFALSRGEAGIASFQFPNLGIAVKQYSADAELSSFIAAVVKSYGSEQAKLSTEAWLKESEFRSKI